MTHAPAGRIVSFALQLARHAPWVALILCLPALGGGLELDDLYFATTDPGDLVGSAFTVIGDGPRVPHFASRDLPWWAESGLQLDFFRPAAGLTHALDGALWPGQPWLMHAHSLAWYVLLVALVRRAYAELGTDPRRADLASIVFAVCQAHAMNVGWIAARNSLVGAVFVVVALRLHHRARSGTAWATAAGPLAFAIALLGNEGAIAGLSLLVAYAVVVDRRRGRGLSLLPFVVVAAGWRLAYTALGYGARHSGMYLDPSSDPIGYAVRTLKHAPSLVAGTLGLGVLDPWASLPGGIELALVGSIPVVALLVWLARDLLRRDRTTQLWALALALACATAGTLVPTDRGLLLLTIPGAALVAELIFALRQPDASRGRRWVGGLLVATHLVISPLLLPLRVRSTGLVQGIVDGIYARLPDAHRPNRHAILVNVPSDLSMLYNRTLAERRDEPFFASLQWLYAGPGTLTLDRVASDAIVLSSDKPWLAAPLDRGFRRDVAFEVGQRIDRECFAATIEAVDAAGLPTAVRFALGGECEIVWLAWEEQGLTPIELPAPGRSRQLAPAVLF